MNEVSASGKFIDIEKVFKQKNAGLGKWIPGFVFSFIRRIIHETEINAFLERNNNEWGIPFLKQVTGYFNASYELVGKENLPESPRVVFAANHPLGGMEGIVLTEIIADQYGDARVPVNDILLSIKNFKPLFIPINKHGMSSKEAILEFDENYKSDRAMLMFPAGYVSRKNQGVIRDIPWRKTFISKAKEHQRMIIPTFVEATNSKRFYRVASFRKFFGIKANLEMFLLPDELFRQKNSKLRFYFGQAVPPDFFDKRHRPQDWALLLQNYVYELPKGEKRSFMEMIDSQALSL